MTIVNVNQHKYLHVLFTLYLFFVYSQTIDFGYKLILSTLSFTINILNITISLIQLLGHSLIVKANFINIYNNFILFIHCIIYIILFILYYFGILKRHCCEASYNTVQYVPDVSHGNGMALWAKVRGQGHAT